MPTYNEKIYFTVRDPASGNPLTSATVQLKRGASTISMSHKGNGLYESLSVPRGYWAVWINGVDSGQSHDVGGGKLEDIGHESGRVARSTSDGWEYIDIDLSAYIRRDGTTPTTAVIPFANGISATTGAFSGVVTASPRFDADGANGANRGLRILTNGAQRWLLRANTDTESGSNAGSNFALTAYDDAGNTIDSPLTIARVAGGAMTLNRPAVISGNLALQSNLLINNPADTFTYTIVGGAITANRQLDIPVITATDTLAVLGLPQTFGAAQTARAWALTNQSNSPATAYTWTLTNGNQADVNLASSTGAVTITTASPTAGAFSRLSVLGHATLARNLTLTQSGVTFVMAGKTSGASILLDSIGALERVCYQLNWITATLCFVQRVNALSGGMQLSGHNQFSSPWSFGNGADWNASTIGQRFDSSGTYQVWAKGNVLVEQSVSQAFTLYRATSANTSEVCLNFDLQDSAGNQESYGAICGKIISSTNGSEKGALELEYKSGAFLTLGATLSEDGFKPVKRNVALTISSILSGLNVSGSTSGTVNNVIQEDGMFGYSSLLGGELSVAGLTAGGSNVSITSGDTLLVFTAPKLIQFPRYHLGSTSFTIGGTKLEFEIAVTGSSSPFTYTVRSLSTFTAFANSGIVSSRSLLIGMVL